MLRIHTHIQGPIVLKAKTTTGVIELRRGHAEVEQDSVDGLDAQRCQMLVHCLETAVHEVDSLGVIRQAGLRRGQG